MDVVFDSMTAANRIFKGILALWASIHSGMDTPLVKPYKSFQGALGKDSLPQNDSSSECC